MSEEEQWQPSRGAGLPLDRTAVGLSADVRAPWAEVWGPRTPARLWLSRRNPSFSPAYSSTTHPTPRQFV